MRKHCGNCANYKKETNQFSEECGKCVSARLENGETTDPSHWRALPQTNADRIRAMEDLELAVHLVRMVDGCGELRYCRYLEKCGEDLNADREIPMERCAGCMLKWLQAAEEEAKADG